MLIILTMKKITKEALTISVVRFFLMMDDGMRV